MGLIENSNGICMYVYTSSKEEILALWFKTHFPGCKIIEQEELFNEEMRPTRRPVTKESFEPP